MAQGATCCHLGWVELQIRIREFQKTWEFHLLNNMQYKCILGIDFMKESKLTLDFDQKSLIIPDDQIKQLPKVEKPVEIDLSDTKLGEGQNPKDIEKTAFITRNGTFVFLRVPFGLSGAVPNFQKAIDIILKPVNGRFVMVYMDDVIITSLSFNEHIDHLNQVFTLLRDAGLTLKKEKFHFARDKLKYLGLIISKEGIETDNSKVKDAFNKVKRALTEAPVLQLLNFQEQFNLFTGASGVGIGAVLNQNHRPIAFASRTLNKAERNCTVTERECLAVIWALNKFKTYFGSLPGKWRELILLRKASAQAIANALFENYISRYGAPNSLISDNSLQFISEVFEHLSHRLGIKHMKTVAYRPQANLTERVNRNLVQMIACFVEENHENWDPFLHEFAFALRTSVNETTNKTPAKLFLGRKIITPFSKLINVTESAEYVGRNIERLFV
ncbi:retrovirus-related Pol polyprotein from transposon 297 [Trichonephila clavipes]|nr:retrovirus-related Pol polyprotein from transposon 297 [Trichonephila clavipes]